jgi:hypothetical protein
VFLRIARTNIGGRQVMTLRGMIDTGAFEVALKPISGIGFDFDPRAESSRGPVTPHHCSMEPANPRSDDLAGSEDAVGIQCLLDPA